MKKKYLINLNDKTFKNYIKKNKNLILIDFWAEWCGPCKLLHPILEDIAEEYKNQLIVATINIDKSSKTAAEYGIRGIPTLLLFKKSVLIMTKIGSLSKDEIRNFLNLYL